jgi:lipopolysaccharide/colanic/teichoic acid biosynthesis glycosyltransferase
MPPAALPLAPRSAERRGMPRGSRLGDHTNRSRAIGGDRRLGLAAKRVFDVVVATVVLVAAVPLLLLIALFVCIDSPGAVLYRQRRVGLDGRVFVILKFRSMVVGADALRDLLQPANEADGPLFKLENDPRVTGVGRWLRKLSLDELPQLLNVVAGDMSLVGPRPALPSEVATYDARTAGRLSAGVRPPQLLVRGLRVAGPRLRRKPVVRRGPGPARLYRPRRPPAHGGVSGRIPEEVRGRPRPCLSDSCSHNLQVPAGPLWFRPDRSYEWRLIMAHSMGPGRCSFKTRLVETVSSA